MLQDRLDTLPIPLPLLPSPLPLPPLSPPPPFPSAPSPPSPLSSPLVVCLWSGLCQMIKQGFGVGLAASELGGHVEDGRGLDRDAGKPPGRLGGQALRFLVGKYPRRTARGLDNPCGLYRCE